MIVLYLLVGVFAVIGVAVVVGLVWLAMQDDGDYGND